jgi:predicted RNase H-like nuclease (RuvC/YqgF family)
MISAHPPSSVLQGEERAHREQTEQRDRFEDLEHEVEQLRQSLAALQADSASLRRELHELRQELRTGKGAP